MTGWLLLSYALGIVCATPPLAYLAERYWSRRMPLIVSVLLLAGSQVMYMEAPHYWVMCFARVIQGISSAAVWLLAFSLLCDTVQEQRFGRQIGIVMTGPTIGLLLGPPLGGTLNETLGYRSPFILAIILCAFDLFGRLLVMERHEAQKWKDVGISASEKSSIDEVKKIDAERSQISFFGVIATLCHSRRALTAFLNTFISGIVFTIMEPTLPLRLQDVYGFTSLKVGLIYLSASVPSIISTILSGTISDKGGAEWVTVISFLASTPWWITMAIRGPLGLFVTSLSLANFFIAATITPMTADLAAAARELEGIGYTHVFGALNFAYSCSTAIGPILGGEIYTVEDGWTVILGLVAILMFISAIASALGLGQTPLMVRLIRRLSGSSSAPISPVALKGALDIPSGTGGSLNTNDGRDRKR